jgi:hypothetical protein
MTELRRVWGAGHVARVGEKRNVYKLLVEKPEGTRPLERLRCRWVDNIKMDLGEIRWGGVDWISLTQARDRWRALSMRYWTFGFHKMLGSYPLSSQLVSSQVVLNSIELVICLQARGHQLNMPVYKEKWIVSYCFSTAGWIFFLYLSQNMQQLWCITLVQLSSIVRFVSLPLTKEWAYLNIVYWQEL